MPQQSQAQACGAMLPAQPEMRKYARPRIACSAVLGEDAGAAALSLRVL